MIEVFRKGQIVPRRLRAGMAVDKKAQHVITFGCDVQVDGRTFRALSDGPVFCVGRQPQRRMNNGTYKKCGAVFKDIRVAIRAAMAAKEGE